MIGAVLAGLLALSVAAYLAVVGSVLAYHKTREGLHHLRAKRAAAAARR
jgi:hypothetical protein